MLLLVAALIAASPATLKTAIASAQPGDTIKLAAATYPLIRIQKRNWAPAVTFDASDATLEGGVTVENSTGVNWQRGNFVGIAVDGLGTRYGVNVSNSHHVTVENARFRLARNGVQVGLSSNVRVANNVIREMSADGIDVFLSRNVVVDNNSCSDFAMSPGAHPDCIQLWSRPEAAPTADVTITNNRIVGDMQGIFLGDHVRAGVPDGGFDRITIRGNTVLNTFGGAIGVGNCRGCVVRDNHVNSLPNYRHKAQLYVIGGSVVACGNVVPMVPKQGTPPCTN